MGDERSELQVLERPGPVLTLVRNHALAEAPFHLVAAQIAWSDGAHSEGWGRDRDLERAMTKAGAEAVERQACAQLPATARHARAATLPTWIHPDALVRYDAQQRCSPHFPFATFSPRQERWWVPAQGVAGIPDSHVLAEFACLPRAFEPVARTRLVTHASSSGCASGSSLDDAIARATLELVERDAFMRHWFAQVPGRAVADATLPAWCRTRLRGLRQQGCRAGVQCLAPGAHPVLLAWAQHRARPFTCVGSAAAFDAELALEAAMNEMETQALARLEGLPPENIAPEQVRSPADHGALFATRECFDRADALLHAGGVRLPFAELASACRIGPAALYAGLRRQGRALRWVDLSLPEAGNFLGGAPLYTVRALAAGLVPMAFGLHRQPFGMAPVAPGGRFPHPFS